MTRLQECTLQDARAILRPSRRLKNVLGSFGNPPNGCEAGKAAGLAVALIALDAFAKFVQRQEVQPLRKKNGPVSIDLPPSESEGEGHGEQKNSSR
jgi:hypothetical protein